MCLPSCSTLVQHLDLSCTVVCQLLPELQQLGVTICFKIDVQLRHCKNPTAEELMWILLYADDISLVCDTNEKLNEAVTFVDATFRTAIMLPSTWLEVVSQLNYVGSISTS